MSLLISAARFAAKPIIERELLKLATPYGVTRIYVKSFTNDHGIHLSVALEGEDRDVGVSVFLDPARDDRWRVGKIVIDRKWMEKIARRHLHGVALPLDPEISKKLELLWS